MQLKYLILLVTPGDRAASYVDRGPAEMPIYQADRYRLIVNVKAASAIGLSLPPSLLSRHFGRNFSSLGPASGDAKASVRLDGTSI
jgi:hypothetical protein